MSKVPVHLLPKSVQTLVEQLVAAGFSLVNATTGNGRRNLGDDGPLRADELQRALQTQLADECHDQSALDISAVRLTRRQSFEDVTITFDTAGLKAAGEADSTPVACVLPSHIRRVAKCRSSSRFSAGFLDI